MRFENLENLENLTAVFAAVLSFFFASGWAQTENPPTMDRDIDRGFFTALKENKKFADVEADRVAIWKQIESLQEKLAAHDPELKKLLEERKKLQVFLLNAGRNKIPNADVMRCRARLHEVNWPLEKAFSKSGEYARLSLRLSSASSEGNLIVQKILYTSPDKRIQNFNKTLEKISGEIISYSVRKLPKAKVEGSDEYKAAVYSVEKYEEDPARCRGTMEYRCAPIRQKMGWRAGKEPRIRELNQKLSLVRAELHWRNCLLQEKKPELAWEVRILPNSPDIRTPEGVRKYNALRKELMRFIQSDPEYAKLEKEVRKLQEEHQKALNDFAEKSSAQEAVEYRKVKAMLDEVKTKTSSGKTK